MQNRSLTLSSLAVLVIPASVALSGCGAAPVDEEAEDFEGAESQPAACPTIGPGCNLPPVPTSIPIPPPPCAMAPASASVAAPAGTATASVTSPNGDYGSSTCPHRFIVDFSSSDSTKRYTVPAPSFQDMTVENELGRAGCWLMVAEVKVLGFNGTWRELSNARYHGVVASSVFTPPVCVALPDVAQPALSLQGYSRIRTAVRRYMAANGVTQYVTATGALRGL